MTTAEEDRIAMRQAEAIGMRRKGKSFRDIATALNVSLGQAHADVRAITSKVNHDAAVDAEVEKLLALERIDAGIVVLNEVLDAEVFSESGDRDHELRLKALDRLVKLEDRRAKLLGLDAPTKQEIDTRLSGSATPAEAARLVREAFGEKASKPAEDVTPALPESPEG